MTELRAHSHAAPVAPPGADRAARPQRRVRVSFLAAGVALVMAATVLVVWGFSRAAERTEVLMVIAPVESGTPIPASAMSTTMVGVDSGIGNFYPAGTDLSGVVAATDLSAGDVLTPSLVIAAPSVPDGWREVGAVVRAGRFPSTVSVGDEMSAVPLDGDGDVSVVVVSSRVGDDGALSAVLAVPATDAARVAQWAAGERLALVRVP